MAQKAPLKPPISSADDPEYAANLRRATLASTAGSALEYFDFALYGLASALIFSKLFFSNLDPATGLIASFATFGVGFVARPLGGLFFGTIGDRLGRKWVLIVTIVLMGGASTLVGALPTYQTIGVWAPILLVFLRLCQGFGAGAEQAGEVAHAAVLRRGIAHHQQPRRIARPGRFLGDQPVREGEVEVIGAKGGAKRGEGHRGPVARRRG